MEKPLRTASGIERTAKEGIPIFDGTPELLPYFREEALTYLFTFETHKRYLAGPRLAKELQGVARTIVRKKNLQDPQWLAQPRGVYALLDYLEQAIERPSLVQASQLVSKFFFQMRRWKQETMTQWINPHSEALWEASRSLKRVQREFGGGASSRRKTAPLAARRREQSLSGRLRPRVTEAVTSLTRTVFCGQTTTTQRMMPRTAGPTVPGLTGSGGLLGGQVGRRRSGGRMSMLRRRPGMWRMMATSYQTFWWDSCCSTVDAHERANILAAIRGQFSVSSVSRALREQWADEDLMRRDRRKDQAMFVEEDSGDEADFEATEDTPDPDGEPEAYAADQEEQQKIDEAIEAIQQHKRTLKDARWRQHQVKLKRKFYPVKGKGKGAASGKSGRDGQGLKCLKCGGPHSTQGCPKKMEDVKVATETSEFAFHAGQEQSLSVEAAMVTQHEALERGLGIVDCGATASLASIDAMEAIMKVNLEKYGRDRVTVLPENRPTFKFGNGQRKECVSTVQLQVDLADQVGRMELHVHDTPAQPALISVKALKNLGAIIDFGVGECVLSKVDPHAIVPLETADNGHLLLPLAHDIFSNASRRSQPLLNLHLE